MADTLRARDADQLAAFARAARPVAAKAVQLTAGGGADGHADRLVEHWRREAVVLTGLTGLGGRLAAAAQDAVSAAVQGSLVV
jgi:acyl-CoA reductase-like NAD-dependent aldehyde dehydrogenase